MRPLVNQKLLPSKVKRTDSRMCNALYRTGVALVVLFVLVPLDGFSQITKRNEINLSPNGATALLLLDSAVSDLTKVEDLEERISLTESIAKILSRLRPERTQQMLDALFEDGLKHVRADRLGNSSKKQTADSQIWAIVRIASSFDSQLAKSYIERYTEERKPRETSESSVQTSGTSRGGMYLRLATELVERDPTLALSVAGSVTKTGLSPEILVFLGTLRKKDIGW